MRRFRGPQSADRFYGALPNVSGGIAPRLTLSAAEASPIGLDQTEPDHQQDHRQENRGQLNGMHRHERK